MSGTRTRTLVFVTALVLCLVAGFSGAFADTRDTEPSENQVINYPAYPVEPLAGGQYPQGPPYIVSATYNPEGPRVVIVFNEGVNPTGVNPEDVLSSNTFDLTQTAFGSDDGDNVLYLTFDTTPGNAGFDDASTEIFAMLPGGFQDATLMRNMDVSPITVGDGPVITSVTISNRQNDLQGIDGPDDNQVVVTFDANVQLVGTDDAAFGSTLEFNGQALDSNVAGNQITIGLATQTADTPQFLYMQPGVMNLRLASGTVRWVANNVSNNKLVFRATANDGPLLAAAYWRDPVTGGSEDADVAIAFDQPITNNLPADFGAEFDAVPDETQGTVTTWFPTSWTNVLRVGSFSAGFIPYERIAIDTNGSLADYQNAAALDPDSIDVHRGLGLVRAAYNRNLTPTDLTDDELYLYFTEPIQNSTDLTADNFDDYFDLIGFSIGDLPVLEYVEPSGPDNFSVVIVRNWFRAQTANPWEQGDRIIAKDPGILPDLVGSISGGGLWVGTDESTEGVYYLPVLDESRPIQLALEDTHETVADAWTFDDTNDTYTIFLRFSENSANGAANGEEDSDEYFLYPIRANDMALWDKTRMATYLPEAIAIGNLSPRQVDGTTRLGVYVSVEDVNPAAPPGTIFSTIDGFDITSPGQLAFLLAAADWQGNLSRIETINPDEYGWTWLLPQPANPDLRVYIQPEYCSPEFQGNIPLYGVHFIHDYEVDRVRFEYLKDDNGNGCDTDAGETWEELVTVGGELAPAQRGDPLMYRNNTDQGCRDDLRAMSLGTWYAFEYDGVDDYYYYDADNDLIYSPRDMVVRSDDDVFGNGDDLVVIGSDLYGESVPDGAILTAFVYYGDPNESATNPAYYWAEADAECPGDPILASQGTELGILSPSDYIFRENREGYVDGGGVLDPTLQGTNLWTANWAPCELDDPDGEYLVRTIAIDRSGNEDEIQEHCYDPNAWNPLEVEAITVECEQNLTVDLTTVDAYVPRWDEGADAWTYDVVTLDLDTTAPVVDQLPPNTRFFRINADVDAPDVEGVVFQVDTPDGSFIVGPNPDADVYSDLDALPGYNYQAGNAEYLDDERFQDDGDFVYEPGTDTVLDPGRNGVVDTPAGQLLIPLVLEDLGDVDQDNDGNILDNGTAQNEIDTVAPFTAWFDMDGYQAPGIVNFTITATANRTVESCPGGAQASADSEVIEINNWSRPLVDVIRVEDQNDAVIDVWHPVADGDPYGIYPTEAGSERTFLIHVTAEDPDGIRWVRLFYRANPACGGTPTVWTLVSPADVDTLPDGSPWDSYPDVDYPYEFHWVLGALDDANGNYQFYAEAMDEAGNLSGIPVFPYGFGFNEYAGQDLAHVVPLANTDHCAPGDTITVGDEYLITAELADPTLEGDVQVRFYYAPRVVGATYAPTDIDANNRLYLDFSILDPTTGGLYVCVNGVEYSNANYTANAGDDFITFTQLPAEGSTIQVSYNFVSANYPDGWLPIGEGDDVAPYTVEWEEGVNPPGVPPFQETIDNGLPGYDLIAVALIDVDGDGQYDPGSMCDVMEALASENGNHRVIVEIGKPIVHLYGLDYEPDFADAQWHYPQQEYWPGNAFGPSNGYVQPDGAEKKLSGVEFDVFVTAAPEDPATIDDVRLVMFHQFHAEPYDSIGMTLIGEGEEFTMPITMYTRDYYEVRPEEIENITLHVTDLGTGTTTQYAMAPDDATERNYYQATATFTTGKTYTYQFFIDKVGDDDGFYLDRRNSGPFQQPKDDIPGYASLIVTPPSDFWYAHLTSANYQENTIYRTNVEAIDSDGVIGSNMSDGSGDPQGPIVYVYDTTAPNIVRLWADPMLVGVADPQTTLWLEANDEPNLDVNVITTRTVVFQYSPLETPDEWITIGIDTTYEDGWFMPWTVPNPISDLYDNDGDGQVDEDDELLADYPVRAVVFDDAGYYHDPFVVGFPGSGNPSYASSIIVQFDAFPPYTHIIDPHDGTVFPYGTTIPVTGVANDTPPEAAVATGVDFVRFQYKDGQNLWVENGTAPYYTHGTDFVFRDENGNEQYDDGVDVVLFQPTGTAPGDFNGQAGNLWFDIDPTVNDNTDEPIIQADAPDQTEFSIDFDTRQVWGTEDLYVRLRMLATDMAGNETIQDDLHAEEIVIILNDITAPTAYLQWMSRPCEPTCAVLSGDEVEGTKGAVTLYGTVLDPTGGLEHVVAVDIEIRAEGDTDWTVLGRDQTPFDAEPCADVPDPNGTFGYFAQAWNTDEYPEGVYEVRAVAVDDDGNRDEEGALIVRVNVDRTPPSVNYAATEGFPGFIEGMAEYQNDGDPDSPSFVIVRDPDTGDVEFRVYTTDPDVQTMTLQWRYPSDPLGLWRPWSEAFNEFNNADRRLFTDFQYEPAQNFDDAFVWIAHAEDFFYETEPGLADYLIKSTFVQGPVEWRVLATDSACNTNSGQTDFVTATVDLTCPSVWDYAVDKPTRIVVPGEEMNFTVFLKDAESDVRTVTLLGVTDPGTPDEHRYVIATGELLPVVEGENVFDLGGPNTQWKFTATWAFPDVVYKDTPLEIWVVRGDVAGNTCGENERIDLITVQDLVPPDNTKIVYIAGQVALSDDPADSVAYDGGLPELLENDNVWVNRDGGLIYTPFGGNGDNDDYLVSEGWTPGVENNTEADIFTLGDELATYPREVNEGYMGNPAANPPRVARLVTLVARTWADDQSFGAADDGIAKVIFLVRPFGETQADTLSKDEYQPFYPLYLWHAFWNTQATLDDGVTPIYPDGDYEIAAYGVDSSGNVEDTAALEWTRVTVDNTPPVATMDADPTTETVEQTPTPIDIERNSAFLLFARILPENPINDDAATFFFKRTRDLNMAGSWLQIPAVDDPNTPINENWARGPEDGNPDDTRPYSFNLDLGKSMDPVDFLHWLNDPNTAPKPGPLHVGEQYDFVAAASDLLGNTTSHLDAFADSLWVRIRIVDTIAPIMTITAVERNIGQTDRIENPDQVHAQSFAYLEAKNLDGMTDLDDVFFVYRPQGGTDWTLLDGTLEELGDGSWQIGPWDLAALEHNAWYEVAAIGVDDVGNQSDPSDDATPKLLVYVDYEAPDNYAFTHPAIDATDLCDWYTGGLQGVKLYDLAVADADDVENVDTWDIVFEYKPSSAIDEPGNWTTVPTGGENLPDHPVIHDDGTNSWWQKWEIQDLSTDLYDIRATIEDVAGNVSVLGLTRLGYDNDEPTDVAISRIETVEGGDIEFHPDGLTDIAAGTVVRVCASAKDDELNLPEDRETGVAQFVFEASRDGGVTWYDLGLAEAAQDANDPTDYTACLDWNTTGLAPGTLLWVGVTAVDECGNDSGRIIYQMRISDIIPPTARIVCFDPDQQPHGENPPTCVKIYALAESDPDIAGVIFQYDTVDGDENHEWVNIGVGEPVSGVNGGGAPTTEVLWWASLQTTSLDPAVTQYWLRAIAKDEVGNQYGDSPDEVVPMMLASLVTLPDGSMTFEPARTTTHAVDNVSVQVESATRVILTVKMADSVERPRVVVLAEQPYLESGDFCLHNNEAWIYSAGTDGDYNLLRSNDDPTVWRGEIHLEAEGCYQYSICVTGTDEGLLVDHVGVAVNQYPVSAALGTNGTVVTPGYEDLESRVTIVSGAIEGEDCLLVSPTLPPTLDQDQAVYLEPVADSAWHIELIGGNFSDFATGYHPTVVIAYDQAAVDAALAGSNGAVTEDMLTVRRWNPDTGSWSGNGISAIRVNTEANTISFAVDNLSSALDCINDLLKSDGEGGSSCSEGNIFQVFAPKSAAPVFVYSFFPHSAYLSDWWTDADPIVSAYLNDLGGQGIDPTTVKVLIDGRIVANMFPAGGGEADYFWGEGHAEIWAANEEGTVWELEYTHSRLQRDWLTEGQHTFTVQYRSYGTSDETSVDTPFFVDLTAPQLAFHGGWIGNPLLQNLAGYIDGGPNSILTVSMYDGGSGIFVRPERQEFLPDLDCDEYIDSEDLYEEPVWTPDSGCWQAVDFGIKYDLWLVHYEDDQHDIDEFEERVLLHQGTADEILPYLQPALYGTGETYDPTDTLLVRLPIVGGGRIQEGDILEVTVYTLKHITSDGPGFGCDFADTVGIGDTNLLLQNCWFDWSAEELHVYDMGVLDQVRNSGSKFIEQRFVVDMLPPACTIVLPGATQDPNQDMIIDVTVSDLGVGLDVTNPTVRVVGPDGSQIAVQNLVVTGNRITGKVPAPLQTGEYTITVTASDRLGHVCTTTKTVRVEAAQLTLTEAYSYPNPFDPGHGDVVLNFAVSKTSDVTIKVYDFAGNFVTNIATNRQVHPGDAPITWGGTNSEGQPLANGAYIVRVVATDGARTEQANLKVVIWRE
ncbi:MAG: FlgD immunoglobulin-like domain containing protein [Candidatus Eisenbacteria bacterium]